MTDYIPPLKDMLFIIHELSGLERLLELETFADFVPLEGVRHDTQHAYSVILVEFDDPIWGEYSFAVCVEQIGGDE